MSDGQRLVLVLLQEPWSDRLQLAGDALLLALAQGVERASELARRCTSELRARGWEGDEDLAEQLAAALGERPAPMLRPLPVDLVELAAILEGDPTHGGGRIDLRTGEVFGVGRIVAYGLVLGGQLRSVKIGRRRLVIRASIEEYVARLEAVGR